MGITEQGLRNFHDVLKEIRACNSEGWFYSEHENIKNIRANTRSKQPPNLGLAIAPGFVLTQGLSFIFLRYPEMAECAIPPWLTLNILTSTF